MLPATQPETEWIDGEGETRFDEGAVARHVSMPGFSLESTALFAGIG